MTPERTNVVLSYLITVCYRHGENIYWRDLAELFDLSREDMRTLINAVESHEKLVWNGVCFVGIN